MRDFSVRRERTLAGDALRFVLTQHYLKRRPPVSFVFTLRGAADEVVGVCTFGVPASREVQKSACPSDPSKVLELNRLWLADDCDYPASRFVAAALAELPPRIIVSYADTRQGHTGGVYRAMSWRYAGWTDMDRKTPRFDYVPTNGAHSRDAFRGAPGAFTRVRRLPKAKYWTTSGGRGERRKLAKLCGWPQLSFADNPVPMQDRSHA